MKLTPEQRKNLGETYLQNRKTKNNYKIVWKQKKISEQNLKKS